MCRSGSKPWTRRIKSVLGGDPLQVFLNVRKRWTLAPRSWANMFETGWWFQMMDSPSQHPKRVIRNCISRLAVSGTTPNQRIMPVQCPRCANKRAPCWWKWKAPHCTSLSLQVPFMNQTWHKTPPKNGGCGGYGFTFTRLLPPEAMASCLWWFQWVVFHLQSAVHCHKLPRFLRELYLPNINLVKWP